MSPRERIMAIVVGSGLAIVALYYGVNLLLIAPLDDLQTRKSDLESKKEKLEKLINSEKSLAVKWRDAAARTFSFEESEVIDLFGQDLKQIAERHGFTAPSLKPKDGLKLVGKNGIATKAYSVSVTGDYQHATDFLQSMYHTPYLTQVTKVGMAPMGPKSDRSHVKLDFEIETIVLPKLDQKKSRLNFVSRVTTMPSEPSEPLTAWRENLPPASAFAVLRDRNVFRMFVPAPSNTIMIDNLDRKTVGLHFKFFWEDKVKEETDASVDGKSQKLVSGHGDVVEIAGQYADGRRFGPERIDFTETKEAAYQVAAHTPEEADSVILAVKNEDASDVQVSVVVTKAAGEENRLPPMIVTPGETVDIGEWKATQVVVSAQYASQKQAVRQTYTPKSTKQTHTVPVEPAIDVPRGVARAPADPPPDPNLRVTGIWTYKNVQEMIVTGASERKVIVRGEENAVDGGELLAVHPLGGVVKMPSGNYYIYPLGKRFVERVLLQARDESELAGAIDEWTRQ
jgi:Tfp pilus assembly protein PilO